MQVSEGHASLWGQKISSGEERGVQKTDIDRLWLCDLKTPVFTESTSEMAEILTFKTVPDTH